MREHALIREWMLRRQRFRTALFSSVHTTTWKRRFQKIRSGQRFRTAFGDQKYRVRVDANSKRVKRDTFANI